MRHAWLWAIPAFVAGAALLRKREEPRTSERASLVRSGKADPVAPGRSCMESRASRAADTDSPELSRQELEEERPGLMTLACEGTPAACVTLAQAIRDPRDHARASDAVGALARFPTETAVNAFRTLLRESEGHLVRLRALQGLVLMIRWTPKDTLDPAGAAVLDRARTVLLSEGLVAAGVIERNAGPAAFRHEAREIQREIDALRR